jgi:hypothetical protein
MKGQDLSSIVNTDGGFSHQASFTNEAPLAKQSTIRVNKTKKISMQRNKKSSLINSQLGKPASKDTTGRPMQPHSSNSFKINKNSATNVKLTPAFGQEAPID